MFLALANPAFAFQGGPIDAPPAAPSAAPVAASAPMAPAPALAASDTPAPTERPVRGPSVRERGGRRSRAGSSAITGFFMIVLVVYLGYLAVKRLRRR